MPVLFEPLRAIPSFAAILKARCAIYRLAISNSRRRPARKRVVFQFGARQVFVRAYTIGRAAYKVRPRALGPHRTRTDNDTICFGRMRRRCRDYPELPVDGKLIPVDGDVPNFAVRVV